MKTIYINPKSGFPYQTTNVPLEKSIEDIKVLLRKFKCEEIMSYESGNIQKLAFKKEGVPYIIDFPQIYEEGKITQPRPRLDISGRIIFNHIKALLLDVEIGTLSFMQAMLRMIALPSPQGVTTLGDVVELQRDNIIKGRIELDPTKIKALTEGSK